VEGTPEHFLWKLVRPLEAELALLLWPSGRQAAGLVVTLPSLLATRRNSPVDEHISSLVQVPLEVTCAYLAVSGATGVAALLSRRLEADSDVSLLGGSYL
jgi:hypothetical protein